MKWFKTAPVTGDILRIKKENIFHYGICVREELAVGFGSAEKLGKIPPENVRVCACPITDFTSEPSFRVGRTEKEDGAFPPEEIAARAWARIGEGNYDFARNNCEHFVYECAVGRHIAPETDRFSALFSALPETRIYLAPTPFSFVGLSESLFPTERRREIEESRNARVRGEKYAVWKLLEKAFWETYGVKMHEAGFRREQCGKWKCNRAFFSLSHTNGACAVAVSNKSVGVDIEAMALPRFGARLARHILTESEKKHYAAVSDEKKNLFCAAAWTGKESVFKRGEKEIFLPSETDGFDSTVCGRVRLGGKEYVFSCACADPKKIRFCVPHGAEIETVSFE